MPFSWWPKGKVSNRCLLPFEDLSHRCAECNHLAVILVQPTHCMRPRNMIWQNGRKRSTKSLKSNHKPILTVRWRVSSERIVWMTQGLPHISRKEEDSRCVVHFDLFIHHSSVILLFSTCVCACVWCLYCNTENTVPLFAEQFTKRSKMWSLINRKSASTGGSEENLISPSLSRRHSKGAPSSPMLLRRIPSTNKKDRRSLSDSPTATVR